MAFITINHHAPADNGAAFVAENATLAGSVRLEKNSSVWYGAVLRADTGRIAIGENSNVQDNAVLLVRVNSEKRADVNAVVHAHPPAATGFAVAHRPMDMYNMIEDVAAIGAVPLTPYGTPSTTEVPDAIEPYLNDHDVMLLENHGALTVGSDVITAYYRMESLELWAKITINAIILGGSYDIDRKNIDKLINLRSYYKITGKHPGYRKFERREKGEPTDK